MDTWHSRMGHLNAKGISKLEELDDVFGIKLDDCLKMNLEVTAMRVMRKLACRHRAYVEYLFRLDMPKLAVHFLQRHNKSQQMLADHIKFNSNFNSSPSLQEESIWLLIEMTAGSLQQAEAVVNAGVVPKLVQLLGSRHQNVCTRAVCTLRNIIGFSPKLRDHVISSGVVGSLIAMITPEIPVLLLREVTLTIAMLCTNPLTDDTVQQILPTLCMLIQRTNTFVLKQVLSALKLLTKNSKQFQMVQDCGIVVFLVPLLDHEAIEIKLAALQAVENIVSLGPECRDYVITFGVIQSLLALINPDIAVILLRHVTWTIANLFKSPLLDHNVNLILPTLCELIHHTDDYVLKHVLLALTLLTNNPEQIHMAIECNIVHNIVPLLNHKEILVQSQALWALGNVVTGSDEQTQVVIDSNALPYFRALLGHQQETIIQDALWVLSNITAGNEQQVKAVSDANLIPLIVRHLRSDNLQTRRESTRVMIILGTIGDENLSE